MKLAEIVPLYKGKEKFLCNNYRPISLLITISKILEKVVYERTYAFLNKTGQLFESQYGFRSKHFCEHAVQELLSNILKGLEHNKKTLAVFLDLSKAFDTITHDILFKKLQVFGVRGSCLDWFKSYLSNHMMRVKCVGEDGNTVFSESQPITYSTPQGSVLGPLIFLIFNNDLHLHLQFSNCILFADDTTIYSTHRDIRHLTWCIREDLEMISDWFKANKLMLNLDKSVCILFGKSSNKRSSCKTELKNLGLPIVDHTKFLGVSLDESLSWSYHYNHIVVKIKCNINLLKRSVHLLNTQTKKVLYYGHIYSHLSYCVSTWGPMLQQTQIKKLQKLQNKCINLIDTSHRDIQDKYKEHKLLQVNKLIQFELSKIGFCMLKKDLPSKILETLSTDQNLCNLKKIHGYNMRQKKLQNFPKVNNYKYHNSFLCQLIKAVQPLLFITECSDTVQQFAKCKLLPVIT